MAIIGWIIVLGVVTVLTGGVGFFIVLGALILGALGRLIAK